MKRPSSGKRKTLGFFFLKDHDEKKPEVYQRNPSAFV